MPRPRSPSRPALRTRPSPTAALAALLVAGVATAEDARYGAADLAALIEQEQWIEFLDHATDLRPSERDARWTEQLGTAAVGALEEARARDPYEAWALLTDLDARFRPLRDSAPWLEARAGAGLEAARDCFETSYRTGECRDALDALVAGDPDSATLAFEAGRVVSLNAHVAGALPFFASAVASAGTAEERTGYCADDAVRRAAVAALEFTDEANVARARELAAGPCEAELAEPLFDAFLDGDATFAANACPLWLGEGAPLDARLTDFQRAHCADAEAAR